METNKIIGIIMLSTVLLFLTFYIITGIKIDFSDYCITIIILAVLTSLGLMLIDENTHLFIITCIAVLVIIIFALSDNINNSKSKYVINLPKEIESVNSQNKMTMYFNKNKDTLHVEYRHHVCSDTTHVSCDGSCECDALGCK